MDKRVLIICRGIQGSGKSTWAKQWCHEDPEHRVRFNNDDVRNMLGDYWVPSREKLVTEAKANMITFALIKGYDVVVDNMNLNPKEDAWIRTLCENIEKDTGIHVNIEYKDFWTPVEECIRREATLGQDAYYCIICTKPDKDFKYKIFGNAYEGSISISKEKL